MTASTAAPDIAELVAAVEPMVRQYAAQAETERRLAQTNFKHKARMPVELMQAFGRKRGRDGVTHVVFGHFHHKTVLPGEPVAKLLPPR